MTDEQKGNDMRTPISRDHVERAASIFGPASVFAQLLRDADRHLGPVQFWIDGRMIVLEKLPMRYTPVTRHDPNA